jgi:hypothetical protein
MYPLFESNPVACSALGLECGTCVHRAASSVAGICCALDSVGATEIFFQLFPSTGCHPMAQPFVLAYREVLETQKPLLVLASAAA